MCYKAHIEFLASGKEYIRSLLQKADQDVALTGLIQPTQRPYPHVHSLGLSIRELQQCTQLSPKLIEFVFSFAIGGLSYA